MSLLTDWPLRKISEPHETNDVLLETKKKTSTETTTTPQLHLQGNQRLLDIIQARKEDYDKTSLIEKPLVTVEILKEWRNQEPMGRFLVAETGTSPPLWRDVGDKKARAHISNILKHTEDYAARFSAGGGDDVINCENDEASGDSSSRRALHSLSSRNNLDWSNLASKLYEREDHVAKLREAFERSITTDQPELVLICGPSGSGKSELGRSMKNFVSEDGFLLWGKFDELRHQDKTYSAFFSAIRQLCRLLKWKEKSWVEGLCKKIHKSVGPEVTLLAEAMPYLGGILNVQAEETSSQGQSQSGRKGTEKSKERFVVAFRRFIRAILDPEHPIILVLDDLQWADEGSLDLLQTLVSPEFGKRRGLLIAGTCRGNEVSPTDHLSMHLRSLESKGTCITNVEVANLSVDTLAEIIVDAGLPADQSAALAEAVHTQTSGNAFFSTQFLQNLQEEGLLKRESGDAGWEWDEDELQLSSRTVGYEYQIVRLLTKKMMQLPPEVQEVLRVAACIGSELRENLLVHACTGVVSSTVLLALSIAEERRVIDYDFDVGVGRFTHDKFHEAALALIPVDQRGAFQLRIGRTLRSQLSEKQFNDNLLLIASLMAQGMDQIESEDEREKVARLCLAAARKAAKASAFFSAIQFVDYGMALLVRRHWRDQYDLSLLLYSLGAELAYCNGEHETVDRLSQAVFDNARNPDDNMQAYTSLILSLDSLLLFEKATEICFDILDQHGQHFPRKIGKLGLFMDFWKTRRMLKGQTAHMILNLPPMRDSNALISMSIIHLLYPILLLNNFSLSPLTAFRLVRLTLQHGLSSMSSVGFAFYASVLVRAGKINEGCYYGELALRIMAKYPVKEFAARTIIAVWGNVKTESEPLASCLGPFMSAHHAALSTGDFNSATACLFVDVVLRFFIGENLPSLVDSIDRAVSLSLDYNQKSMVDLIDPLKQACLNLMGRSENPLVLTGEAMDEEQWNRAVPPELEMMTIWYLGFKMHLAIFMNEFEVAARYIEDFRKRDPGVVLPYIYRYNVFYRGIVAAAASRKSYRCRWRARKYLRYLEQAMLQCPENHTNKVFLVRAELAASSGKCDEALLHFDRSIHYAEKEGFLSEQAFAQERAARMCLSSGQSSESVPYFHKAIQLYKRWGATVKVDQLQRLMADEKLNLTTSNI